MAGPGRVNWREEQPARRTLVAIQTERLKLLVRRAYEHIPFYRHLWETHGFSPADIKSARDVTKIPFVTKKDIAASLEQHPPFGDYQGDFRAVRIQASTGSTGKPKPIFHTRSDWENIALLWARRLRAQGVRAGDIVQIAFAYTLFIVGFTSSEGAMRLGATVVPAGSGAVTPSERQLQLMSDWRTAVVGCTGSYMLNLAEVARSIQLDPRKDFAVRVSFHTAEPLTEAMRAQIQAEWGCKAFDNYGSVETGAPAYECEEQRGLHVSEDAYIFEIIDPHTGEPVPDGEEGELVVTTLIKEAAPFIRYRIGDITSFIPEPCACGRTFKRLAPIRGRVDDMIKVKGVAIYPTDFEPSIKRSGLFSHEYLITVWREGYREAVKVSVEYVGPMGEQEQACTRLASELRSALGLRCEVETLAQGEIKKLLGAEKRIKYKRIRDLRK
jgi:phenylacetate-CoA ligase